MKKCRNELEADLAEVDRQIAANPLASDAVRDAHAITERYGEGGDADPIAREVSEKSLPNSDALGRIQAQHTMSWWKLHRSRNKIQHKLDGFDR